MASSRSVLPVCVLAPAVALGQGSPPPQGPAPAVPRSADDLADLEEKILRTKARLANPKEMVMGGDVTSRARAGTFEPTQVEVVGMEKRGITHDIQDCSSVRYDVDVGNEDRSQARPAAAPAGGAR